MTIMWYMVPEIWTTTDFFVIMCHFLPFYPLNSPQNKNIKKMKKIPGDIIILHKYPKNHDHMLYCSRHTARDTCNCYFSFWALFCPFTPITDWKTKISGKIKKTTGNIIILHMYTKIMIICYTVPEIWHVTHVVIFHFGLFFALLPI